VKNAEPHRLSVVEEQASIGKRQVVTGRTKIKKTVREQPEDVEQDLLKQEVEVERVPTHQVVPVAPEPRMTEGGTLVIPVVEEVLKVEKVLVVTEEIRITQKYTRTKEKKRVSLRKEKVTVDET
jgi:uncharacterized protein (TIGR02271 family)